MGKIKGFIGILTYRLCDIVRKRRFYIRRANCIYTNLFVGKFNGKLNLWNKLRLMWELKVKKSCDRIFGMIFAVTPEFQGKGVESGMIQYIYENYIRTDKNNYKTVEFAWIGDFNPVMNRMIQNYVGATRHKMHTTYRYLFDREKPFTRCPRLGIKKSEK